MAGGGGGSEYEVGINLTALLDVLTNLLFFLMFGYAAQQMSLEVDEDVRLPETWSEMAPKKTVSLVIGQAELRLDSERIAAIQDGEIVAPTDKQGNIVPLYRELVKLKDKRGTTVEDHDVVLIMCDKRTPYGAVKSIMMTSAAAGFHRFRLAALIQ